MLIMNFLITIQLISGHNLKLSKSKIYHFMTEQHKPINQTCIVVIACGSSEAGKTSTDLFTLFELCRKLCTDRYVEVGELQQ